jgi:hypothetical protein
MPTDFESALFSEELANLQGSPESLRWALLRDPDHPLGILLTLHPKREPRELYKARIRWGDYFAPFSLKFLNLETGSDTDTRAWPRCHGFRPGNLDACIPWTSEGHITHPEWKSSKRNSFPKVELPMQHAVLLVQVALDNSYQGRGPA